MSDIDRFKTHGMVLKKNPGYKNVNHSATLDHKQMVNPDDPYKNLCENLIEHENNTIKKT
jgi:hypothetical protein